MDFLKTLKKEEKYLKKMYYISNFQEYFGTSMHIINNTNNIQKVHPILLVFIYKTEDLIRLI